MIWTQFLLILACVKFKVHIHVYKIVCSFKHTINSLWVASRSCSSLCLSLTFFAVAFLFPSVGTRIGVPCLLSPCIFSAASFCLVFSNLATALVNSSWEVHKMPGLVLILHNSYVQIVSGIGSGSDNKKLFVISQLIIATRLSTILTEISSTCLIIQGTERKFKYCWCTF